ncbi:type IV pilus assembly protein PilM [Candidatus Falkowbacteria bacterium]|jgi:type IV pilus assembly protein PilM|nr:MAG: type IV pilus assembly protein PilM [Candidatus Falkowbacteria bacterium]
MPLFNSLFTSSTHSYLGIDISAPGIKMVELARNGNQVALLTYGFSEQKIDSPVKDMSMLDVPRTAALIHHIAEKAHVASNLCLASLPTSSVFSSIININQTGNKKDLEAAINWEAKKVIPLALQDIVLDWQKIEGGQEGNNMILLTGAPKALIQNYISIFKAAQRNLLSLETEIFALIRSLLGNDRSPVMIVQMGSTTTNIFVVDKCTPVINRSIGIGGNNITKSIAEHLNLSLEQAEQFKYDLMHSETVNGKTEVLPAMIIEALGPIINEIKYIFEVFGNKESRRMEKIILTGGGALLPGLTNYLSDQFNVNTIVGDPWFRISYPFELKPILEKIGPRLAVAIGLAMREFDKK